jgi:hypothetical protein
LVLPDGSSGIGDSNLIPLCAFHLIVFKPIRTTPNRAMGKLIANVIIFLILCGIGFEVYRYLQCRNIGHTATYCLTN